MAGNPGVQQGVIQRLRASVTFADFPALNVTASYLGRAGIRLGFTGNATVLIDTMTGVVQSPEPYVQFALQMHLVMSQGFADVWKRQIESNTLIGNLTVRPSSTTLSPYKLSSGTIITPSDELDFSGASAEFVVRMGGTYALNNNLWP